MWFRSGFHSWKSRSPRTPARPRGLPAARLVCEMLEARCLLSYTITDLGGLPEAFPVETARDINNQGQVAGRTSLPSGADAVLWDNSVVTQLGTHGGTAYGINDQSEVVGDFRVSGSSHAFLWQDGVLTDLGTPQGSGSSQAVDINNNEQIAVYTGNTGSGAFLWQAGVWTDLGTLGGRGSIPSSMNDRGQVVGTSHTARGDAHAFLWQDGVMMDLGTLGDASNAADINNQGQVVGQYFVSGGTAQRAFLWQDGVMTDLGTLGGSFSTALGINDQGQIVGSSTTASGAQHAFLWDHGTMTDLGIPTGYDQPQGAFGINDQGQVLVSTISDGASFLWQKGVWTAVGGAFKGYSSSFAVGINNQSQVVGYSYVSPNTWHAVLWQAGTTTDLGTLGGSISFAWGINDQGQVVGSSTTASGAYHAFLWQDGVMTDLGTLGGSDSFAYGINNQGQVVGTSGTASGPSHAFLWENGWMTDLGTLGDVSSADRINNAGQIVGFSALSSAGPTHAFLWDGASGMQDLGTLAGDTWSNAAAIDDVGQVIGVSGATVTYTDAYFDPESGDCFPFDGSADFPHAVLWHNGSVMSIGSLAGTNGGQALAVNNAGQVIGYSFNSALVPNGDCPGTVHYVASRYQWFLWQDGVTIDFGAMLPPDSGWTIQSVSGINDAGEIIGYGRNPQGQTHAFLLTPDNGSSPRSGSSAKPQAQLVFPQEALISDPPNEIPPDRPLGFVPPHQWTEEPTGQVVHSEVRGIAQAARRERMFTAGIAGNGLAAFSPLDLLSQTALLEEP